MAATPSEIARLRRMTAEPTDAGGYTDAVLKEAIERYPLFDADGWQQGDDEWVETWDLNAAAYEVWTEKSAALSQNMDFSADGSSFKQSQQYEQAMKMARHYGARRSPGSIRLVVEKGPVVVEEL